jgi:prepilin-type N-terminal cleavage/methylation domain-containing protein/prepilin-type processing-associated H-X9-DG protein
MSRKMNPNRAFTLIELLVVISIIALLLAILIPMLGKARSLSKRVVCAGNLRQINLAVHLYTEANNDTYPSTEDPVYTDPNTGAVIWLWMGRGWRSFIEPHLGANIDVKNPSVLFCPEDKTAPEKYESTSYSYSMAFYHSPEQIDSMTSPSDTCGSGPFVQSILQQSAKVVRPSEKIIIGEWNSNHLHAVEKGWFGYGGWWCWEGSRNYLFADGSIDFIKAKDIAPARDGYPNPNLTIHGVRGSDLPNR